VGQSDGKSPFGRLRHEVKGEWGKLENEELGDR